MPGHIRTHGIDNCCQAAADTDSPDPQVMRRTGPPRQVGDSVASLLRHLRSDVRRQLELSCDADTLAPDSKLGGPGSFWCLVLG
jgi:hypothetical protein